MSSTKKNTRTVDSNTLSNSSDFVTTHTELDYELSFKKRQLVGMVEHRLRCVSEGGGAVTDEIWLDSSYVEISDVRVDGKELGKEMWELEPRTEPFGSRLTVRLGRKYGTGEEVMVKIGFATTNECTALGWMDPEQTSNKKHPYMYSQCQAIHCRSLFPCQDTPFVKATYKSTVRSPLPVVISGISNITRNLHTDHMSDYEYEYEQKIPIPSYLYAIASGDIVAAEIGPRSQVWTGPDELAACRKELEGDTEKFIEVAEKLIYDYPWGTYNVLVLPPSFPYGGMENPNMTFATPTIIAGDKSNIDVIAHELAHSWSGNLVTNSSWEHFWLNEGWTTYIERRIVGALHGEEMFHFSAIIGWKALKESIELFGEDHEFTKLVINLDGQSSDDAFSSIPYEKGFNFLFYLDSVVGRAKWDTFIKHYFSKYKMKSLTSFDFRSTLLDFFAEDKEVSKALEDKVNWEQWFYQAGYPPVPKPAFDDTLARPCYALADCWAGLIEITPSQDPSNDEESKRFIPHKLDVADWSPGQLIVFLEKLSDLPKPLGPALSNLMDSTYNLTDSKNAEILSRFYTVALKSKDMEIYHQVSDFLGTVGRMKFVRPLFRLLNECDRGLAVKTFGKYATFYHPICREAVRKDLKLEGIF